MIPANRILSLLILITLVILTACEGEIPPPPEITVVITAVDDTEALENAVVEAIEATEQVNRGMTETALAGDGITLTPSLTWTPSATPTASATRLVTATRTPTATITPTTTFAPFETNTPSAALSEENVGWIRVLHTVPTSLQRSDPRFDVYLNDGRLARALDTGGQTAYQQVPSGEIRITLRTVEVGATGSTPQTPLISRVFDVPLGGALSVVIMDVGNGLELIPVTEDITPLESQTARLTVIQANPFLLESNLLSPTNRRAIANNLTVGEVIGPFDMPSGRYPLEFYDTASSNLFLGTARTLDLANRASYILVLTPATQDSPDYSNYLLFTGTTRRIDTDTSVRFVNVADTVGPVQVVINGEVQFIALPVGVVTDTVPVSIQGSTFTVLDSANRQVYTGELVLPSNTEAPQDKIVMIHPLPGGPTGGRLGYTVYTQNPARSSIRANLRLIHGLPNTIPISLQIRDLTAPLPPNATEPIWTTVTTAEFGGQGGYVGRTPGIFDVRVVLTGTENRLAESEGLQFIGGGIYDFMAVPGSEVGSTNLIIVQPQVQLSQLGSGAGSPALVAEAVEATLTAIAPVLIATPTRAATSTPTITPVATNTPRPTNTASVHPPTLLVVPTSPDTVQAGQTIVVRGQNFAARQAFTISLNQDSNRLQILSGSSRVNDDGTLDIDVQIPSNAEPGLHILRLCVDCRANGANQEVFAVVNIANIELTPSVTPTP